MSVTSAFCCKLLRLTCRHYKGNKASKEDTYVEAKIPVHEFDRYEVQRNVELVFELRDFKHFVYYAQDYDVTLFTYNERLYTLLYFD